MVVLQGGGSNIPEEHTQSIVKATPAKKSAQADTGTQEHRLTADACADRREKK